MYNPLDKTYKSVTGAVVENTPVVFRVKANKFCNLVVYSDEESEKIYPMQKEGDFYKIEISFSRGLYFYYFICEKGKIYCGKNHTGEILEFGEPFELTAYKKGYKTPKWLKGGIIYQIFPDRFYRGEKDKPEIKNRVLKSWGETPEFLPNEKGIVLNNDFFGGDFKGITQKLDYLKSLSVSAIYLNPIFKASSNHRYDTGDYNSFDPYLGEEKDFIKLVKTAEKKGIKIILDGVFNHTGDDSIYFNKYGNYPNEGAYFGKESKYYDWYKFKNFPDDYECWWDIKILPMIDKDSKSFQKFIAGKEGVVQKYVDLGAVGFRLDVVDELKDGFVKEIRKRIKKSNKDGVVIGEVWEDATNKIAYGERRKYFLGEELDSVMNYPLKNAILSFVKDGDQNLLSKTIKEQIDRYPEEALNVLMNLLSSHDTYRLISAISDVKIDGDNKLLVRDYKMNEVDYKLAVSRLKIATLLNYSLYGVPSVYYGDEIGMEGYRDPLNRKCFTWDNIDFEILEWYKKLGKIRKKYDCFINGKLEEIYAKDGVYAFTREGKNSEILCVANAGETEFSFSFDGKIKSLINGKIYKNNCSVKERTGDLFIAL